MFFSISRHADSEPVKAIRTSSQQAQSLSRLSATIAGRFLQAVQQATLFVLPDVKLALKEKEPTLATSLLAMLDDGLAELKTQGDDMQRQHMELQCCVQGILCGTQSYKPDPGCALAQAILLMKAEKQPDSPRSVQTSSTEYESSEDGDQSSDDDCRPGDCKAAQILDTTTAVGVASRDHKAAISQALEELKQVNDLVEADLGFWREVSETVQKLKHMKHHTSCLLQCASSSERLRARVEQRVDEYNDTWASLERHCQEYVARHEKTEVPMCEISMPHEVEESTDFADVQKAHPQLSR